MISLYLRQVFARAELRAKREAVMKWLADI